MTAFDDSVFEQHKAEAKARWGNTEAYQQHTGKTKNHSKQKWNDLAEEMNHIMAEFAVCMKQGKAADSAETQNLVKTLQNHITAQYYDCTNSILAGLGQMYVADERFKANIDQHGDGTAVFICEAIQIYCRK